MSDWLAAGGDTATLIDSCRAAPIFEPHFKSKDEEKQQAEEQERTNTDDVIALHWHGEPDTSPLREWAVDEMLPMRGTAILPGQWGTYKTFVEFDLAAAIMTGTPFAGRNVNRQGGVLLIAVEGQDEVRVRLAAVIEEKIAPLDADMDDRVAVDPAAMPFAWIEACPQLTGADALPALRKIVAAAVEGMRERFGLPLALISIDTLSPAAGFKDANDSAEAQRVMTLLKKIAIEFDLCVVAVDHFGKDVSTGTRNSSVKEADADAVLALLGERDLAGNVTNPRLALRKLRGGPTGQEIPFSPREVCVESQGRTFSTLVIDWDTRGEAAATPKRSKWSKSLLVFKTALEVMMTDVGRTIRPFHEGPEVLAVDREKVRDEFLKAYPADSQEAKKTAFLRCERQARERGVIVSHEIENVTFFWMARGEDEVP